MFKLVFDPSNQWGIKFNDGLANRAEKVVVLGGQSRVESLLTPLFIEAAGADQTFLLQPVQGAVDSGEVQAGIALLDNREYFLCGRVAAETFQSLQNIAPLGSHPAPLGV
jgi:hypothetical protein